MRDLPAGTVTFVFTDVEGSTLLIQRLGAAHRGVFEVHSRLVRKAMGDAGGIEVGERGDGFLFVFTSALDAVGGAAAAHRALAAEAWPPQGQVRIRIGIHTGEGLLGGDNYMGIDVNRAARIGAAGHGGQALVSSATAELVRDALPEGLSLRDLGSHHLKDLPRAERLWQLAVEGLPADFPPPRTLGSTPNNLPAQLTSFVGREREIEEVRRALDETRLLTLTGLGGTGKTRLGLRAAAEAAPAFPDGVFFVPLAAITDASLLAPSVLSAIGWSHTTADPALALREYLRSRRMLLMLDNFEQVLEAGPQVSEWLREAAGIKALTTSRTPLRLSGEREYPVPPLRLPGPSAAVADMEQCEAVALFVARARAARPDFRLTFENAAAVAAIAARLDGLPLAIELAASRAKLLPPAAILQRLSSRLAFLTGGPRDAPARQQTLRDAIMWSYDQLDDAARRLFCCLGVFAGGFSLPEAEAVCAPPGAEILDGLATLLDHGLLRQDEAAGEPRFWMLETIRELALKNLSDRGELQAAEERHSTVFLALAEEAGPHLTRTGRRTWLDRLEQNVDNIRAALSRSIGRKDAGPALRMVAALWRFWQMRGHIREGRERAAEALTLSPWEPRDRIGALRAAGGMAYWRADMKAAAAAYREALALARGLGDQSILAQALCDASYAGGIGGDIGEALAFLEESLAIAQSLGDPSVVGEVLWATGTIHWYNGRHLEAEPWYDRALAALEGSDAVFSQGWALRMRGTIRGERGDIAGARADLEKSMRLFAADDDLSGVGLHLQDFAVLALAAGDPERALRLAGAAAAAELASETGMLAYTENKIPALSEAAPRIGRERAEALLAEGRAMAMKQAIAYALEPFP